MIVLAWLAGTPVALILAVGLTLRNQNINGPMHLGQLEFCIFAACAWPLTLLVVLTAALVSFIKKTKQPRRRGNGPGLGHGGPTP